MTQNKKIENNNGERSQTFVRRWHGSRNQKGFKTHHNWEFVNSSNDKFNKRPSSHTS